MSTSKANICDASNIVWIDCEMTGLDAQTDQQLEIAVIVTDKDLNVLAEGQYLVIHQPGEVYYQTVHICKIDKHVILGFGNNA